MKQNTTHGGLLGFIEKIIRLIPIIYIFFRSIVKYTNYFEDDFYYLIKIFKKKKINIIDVGASDGISSKFFLNNLNVNKIFCFEPQKTFYPDLFDLKKKNSNIRIFKHGLGLKKNDQILFVPYTSFFGKIFYLSTYTFPKKKDLLKQIKLDFLIQPKVEKIKIKLKKFKPTKDKIDLIKIDTNGSEYDVILSLINLIKKYKPVLIIENNDVKNIYNFLSKYGYQKFFVSKGLLKRHINQNSGNVIFKKKI